jgi:hypothetical protein
MARPTSKKSSPYLLPHERWMADRNKRSRDSRHPLPPATVRNQQNYGPEGMRLIDAALANSLVVSVVCPAGAVAGGLQSVGVPFVMICLFAIGAPFFALALIRVVQCARAGRQFRGERPFVR